LPVIVSGKSSSEQRIVALPSLGWSSDEWVSEDMSERVKNVNFFYDIRYKRIDDSLTRPIGSQLEKLS